MRSEPRGIDADLITDRDVPTHDEARGQTGDNNAPTFAWMRDASLGIPPNELGKFHVSFGICCSREAQSNGGRKREIQTHNHSKKRYDVALALAASLWLTHHRNEPRFKVFVAAGYIKGNEESERNLANLQKWLARVEGVFSGEEPGKEGGKYGGKDGGRIVIWPYDVSSFANPYFACIRAGQIGRFYAHESGLVQENDFVSVSDTDLFPINRTAMMPMLDGRRNPNGDFHRVFVADWEWIADSGRTIPIGLGLGQTAFDWERSFKLVLGSAELKDAINEADRLTQNTWGFDQTLSTRAIRRGGLCNFPSSESRERDDAYTCFKGNGGIRKECLNVYDKEKLCNYAHFTPDVKEESMRRVYDDILADLRPTLDLRPTKAERILGKQQAEEEGPTILFNPKLFSRSEGWNGTSYEEGMTFCSSHQRGSRSSICPWELYCPGGQLAPEIRQHGLDEEVIWSPVPMQGQAVWVSIGSVNTCIQSGSPSVAMESEANYIMCCRKGMGHPKDSRTVEERKTTSTDELQSLRRSTRPGVDFDGCAASFEGRSCDARRGTRRPSLPFVTGDFFRCFADVVFDETNGYQATEGDVECLRSLQGQEAFRGPFLVFVKTDLVHNTPGRMKEIDDTMPGEYVLITHNSDYGTNFGISNETAAMIEGLPKLVHWYGQNIEPSALRTTVPVGLENYKHGRMRPELYSGVSESNVPKTDRYLASANFRPRNDERRALLERLRSFEWVDPAGWGYRSAADLAMSKHEAWLRKQAEYRFAISPPGNGVDCHRTWEMILVGVIPVMRSTIIDSVFADLRAEGAVLIVDEWSDLNRTLLEGHWENFGRHLAKRRDSWLRSDNNNMLATYWARRLTSVGANVGRSNSAVKPRIHFRTYANEVFEGARKRIVQEAIETGWFSSARGFRPEDMSEEFRQKYKELLVLPRGGGYWIWKFHFIERTVANELEEGDFLVFLDAGSHINKGGERRFFEYIDMVDGSPYDLIGFQLRWPEYKWTTPRIFQAFNMTKAGDASFALDGQIEGGTQVIQKGPHFRKWIEMCWSVIEADPWLLTEKYNNEARELEPAFKENRHDQSVMSLSRKKLGYVWVDGAESKNAQPDKPFHVTRKRD